VAGRYIEEIDMQMKKLIADLAKYAPPKELVLLAENLEDAKLVLKTLMDLIGEEEMSPIPIYINKWLKKGQLVFLDKKYVENSIKV
jgi:hypothetical protein